MTVGWYDAGKVHWLETGLGELPFMLGRAMPPLEPQDGSWCVLNPNGGYGSEGLLSPEAKNGLSSGLTIRTGPTEPGVFYRLRLEMVFVKR